MNPGFIRVLLAALGISLLSMSGCSNEPASTRPASALPVPAGQIAAGRVLFEQECAKCHGFVPGRNSKGPQLLHAYGNRAGLLTDYPGYSAALKQAAQAGLHWDSATLDRYLQQPEQVIPQGKMLYDGLADAQARRDVIAYMASQQPASQ